MPQETQPDTLQGVECDEEDCTQCEWCNKQIDNIYECDDGLYCESCYYDHTDTCAWCEKRYKENTIPTDYVAVFDAEEAGIVLPGFYRVRETPYYRQPLIGPGQLYAEALQWLGHLPAGLEEPDGYPCGYFCRACQHRMLGMLVTEQNGAATP